MDQNTKPMIDTHQHFWRLSRGGYAWMPKDLPALYRDYEPEHLQPLLQNNGITRTIVVQADDTVAETEFLLDLANTHSWIAGVVGWVDLEGETAADTVQRLAASPKFLGIRPMIQDIADDQWMLRSNLEGGLAAVSDNDLTFDALVLQKHLPVLDTFLSRYPDLRVVIDHCAKPDFTEGRFEDWAQNIAAIAAHPNTFCKLSGLLTEAPAGAGLEDLKPYLDHVLGVFGPDRVLFGSDWPVLNLVSDYDQWVGMMRQYADASGLMDWDVMMSDTPCHAYPRLVRA